ncbi:MAG TPA: cytochrome c maturation protein CcmE [Candidatus Polarisedimenticolia bacterium]|nr:cytochrome c maturation protein CcmE [Candidatus Polarisedimenticolia bacterium]
MGNRFRLALLTLLVVAAVGYLILSGVKQTGMQYMTVTELARLDRAPKSDGFRLDGTVAPGSVAYDQKTPQLRFQMTDGKEKIAVIYDGLKPDAFADGREVVVEGAYKHDDKALHASKLVTKCPSKYEAKGLGKDRT